MKQTSDLRVEELIPLIPPQELGREIAITEEAAAFVSDSRQQIVNIIQRQDKRLLVIVGPCSIHDEQMANDYASRLAKIMPELSDRLYIIMRVYFEKPRTSVGWKGLISDPHMDGSTDMATGLRTARRILLNIAQTGVPTATEMLDPIIPQYTADLISWGAIGARTTESQTHREMSSGLSMPIGYKNSTEGDVDAAINAIKAARECHTFLGINAEGHACIVKTRGNSDGHVILRGGRQGANFDPVTLQQVSAKLKAQGLIDAVVVDCSHDNSGKIARNQELVCQLVINERLHGYPQIVGVMLESNINEGKQPISPDLSKLCYGVSVTDDCMGWEQTEKLLRWMHSQLG
ncbi:MAG: 3-deoxy-7-phosphoheptulonate synthase [Deltaproteobacteria bacterium]|nr:3-deoxy-7-phosphoheptulonate synthase [Deltaproteobacteria bacterium]